jgi:hypothetical protein
MAETLALTQILDGINGSGLVVAPILRACK